MKQWITLMFIVGTMIAYAGEPVNTGLFAYDETELSAEMQELDELESSILSGDLSVIESSNILFESGSFMISSSQESSGMVLPSFMRPAYQSLAGIFIVNGQFGTTEIPKWVACIVVGGLMFGIYALVAALT